MSSDRGNKRRRGLTDNEDSTAAEDALLHVNVLDGFVNNEEFTAIDNRFQRQPETDNTMSVITSNAVITFETDTQMDNILEGNEIYFNMKDLEEHSVITNPFPCITYEYEGKPFKYGRMDLIQQIRSIFPKFASVATAQCMEYIITDNTKQMFMMIGKQDESVSEDLVWRAFHVYACDKYIYCDKTRSWYVYVNNGWIASGDELSAVEQSFVNSKNYIKKVMEKDNTKIVLKGDKDVMLNKKAKTMGKYSNSNLKTNSKRCKSEFDKNGLVFDHNVDVTRFRDCVFCVSRTEPYMSIRNGRPGDGCTKQVNMHFMSVFNFGIGQKYISDALTWLQNIFGNDQDKVKNFLRYIGSCYFGGNNEKLSVFWSGEGNNSKSMMVHAFEQLFGTYLAKVPSSRIYHNSNGNSSGNEATPCTMQLKNTKIAFVEEPSPSKMIDQACIKQLTGGDDLYVRGLYRDAESIQSTWKFVIMCNSIPAIDLIDTATRNRLSIFNFVGTWVIDRELVNPDEGIFFQDINFKKKIPDMAKGLLWLVTHIYLKHYIEKGVSATPWEVEEYMKSVNLAKSFFQEAFVWDIDGSLNTNDDDDYTLPCIDSIHTAFLSWSDDRYPERNKPTKNQLHTSLQTFIAETAVDGEHKWVFRNTTISFIPHN